MENIAFPAFYITEFAKVNDGSFPVVLPKNTHPTVEHCCTFPFTYIMFLCPKIRNVMLLCRTVLLWLIHHLKIKNLHSFSEEYTFVVDSPSEDQKPTLLFTNNESRSQAMSQSDGGVYTKDGINQYVVHGMSQQLWEVRTDQHWERENSFACK